MNTGKGMLLAAVAAGMMWAGGAQAGALTPTSGPAPTLHTLEEIHRRLAELERHAQAAGNMLGVAGDMALIPAGSFVMGATTNVGHESYFGETPQHTVTISAFYMDTCEVTKARWDLVYTWAASRGYGFANADSGKADNHPVIFVSWYDAVKWCNARSERDGFAPCYTTNGVTYKTGNATNIVCNWSAGGYRLPTEAEWEKAARGGVANRRFPWSDVNTIQHARANYMATPASCAYDTSPTTGFNPSYTNGVTPYTSPVGAFAPNGYGLYDMAGNVYEWCWDWHSFSYYSNSPGDNPTGPTDEPTYRVLRGGSWLSEAQNARCAPRNGSEPVNKHLDYGFRCARGL